jgi:hypothetical protein
MASNGTPRRIRNRLLDGNLRLHPSDVYATVELLQSFLEEALNPLTTSTTIPSTLAAKPSHFLPPRG